MKAVILLSIFIAIALAAPAPPTPQIPETFEANIHFDIYNATSHIHADGQGIEARNVTLNSGLLHAFFDEKPNPFIFYDLARYDLAKDFVLDNANWTKCNNFTLTGNLPSLWSWLANATYVGTSPRNEVQFWNASVVYGSTTVHFAGGFFAVNSTVANTPLWRSIEVITGTSVERNVINYDDFNTVHVSDNDFVLPKQCGGMTLPYFLWL